MLNYELTQNHTRIALWSDYATLERLHQFVHEVVAESSVIEDKEGSFWAWPLRKVFKGATMRPDIISPNAFVVSDYEWPDFK